MQTHTHDVFIPHPTLLPWQRQGERNRCLHENFPRLNSRSWTSAPTERMGRPTLPQNDGLGTQGASERPLKLGCYPSATLTLTVTSFQEGTGQSDHIFNSLTFSVCLYISRRKYLTQGRYPSPQINDTGCYRAETGTDLKEQCRSHW